MHTKLSTTINNSTNKDSAQLVTTLHNFTTLYTTNFWNNFTQQHNTFTELYTIVEDHCAILYKTLQTLYNYTALHKTLQYFTTLYQPLHNFTKLYTRVPTLQHSTKLHNSSELYTTIQTSTALDETLRHSTTLCTSLHSFPQKKHVHNYTKLYKHSTQQLYNAIQTYTNFTKHYKTFKHAILCQTLQYVTQLNKHFTKLLQTELLHTFYTLSNFTKSCTHLCTSGQHYHNFATLLHKTVHHFTQLVQILKQKLDKTLQFKQLYKTSQ